MTLTFYVIPLPTISLSTSQPFTLIIIQKLLTTKDIDTKGSASKGIKIPGFRIRIRIRMFLPCPDPDPHKFGNIT